FRPRQLDPDLSGFCSADRLTLGLLNPLLIPILAVLETEACSGGVLPARGPHVGDAGFALLIGGPSYETHFLRVAGAGRARQLVSHSARELRYACTRPRID